MSYIDKTLVEIHNDLVSGKVTSKELIDEALYKAGLHAKQIEGNSQSTWILMDYQDIIVHLFSKEDRLFYDLERIWRDGKIVEL